MTNSPLRKGDHIRIARHGVYTHHGIYIGEGRVIHYTGDALNKRGASIRETSLHEFLGGGTESAVEVVKYGRCDQYDVVINRAKSRLGENGYSLFGNNCEHFAFWCKTGRAHSDQVNKAQSVGAGSVGAYAATSAGMSVVGGAGVAGMSGAGVMSGLATVGSAVGGGAVAGIGVLATAPALLTTVAMRSALADDEALSKSEREARSVGRGATMLGAAGGTAGSIAAVSAAGSVAGLSGAGITSGLAAVGATVGGGMAAGTAVVVAAPAVAAAAIGYASYKLASWLFD